MLCPGLSSRGGTEVLVQQAGCENMSRCEAGRFFLSGSECCMHKLFLVAVMRKLFLPFFDATSLHVYPRPCAACLVGFASLRLVAFFRRFVAEAPNASHSHGIPRFCCLCFGCCCHQQEKAAAARMAAGEAVPEQKPRLVCSLRPAAVCLCYVVPDECFFLSFFSALSHPRSRDHSATPLVHQCSSRADPGM